MKEVPFVSTMMECFEPLPEIVKRFPRPRRIISKIHDSCPDGFFLIDPDAAATLPDNWIGPDPRPLFFVFSPATAADAMARNIAAAYMPEGVPAPAPLPRTRPFRCRACGIETAGVWYDGELVFGHCPDDDCPSNDIPF